ncbi:F-box protein At4g00755-like [Lolium rigidum]|uniref:F-box protein At4g00755-like n=1 Tax=Lolium rigidum TaxID=89674 RepID=UPI001F5C3F1A|nr:F-box protein At4g00755-like [Lolium rigidum]
MEAELPEQGQGMDFLQCVGPDASAIVFRLLDDPADLARASAVSRSWRRFVIQNQFSKIQCLRAYPEVANFMDIEVRGSGSSAPRNARWSAAAELDKLERDHRVYMQLSHGLLSPYNAKDCISHCVGASSTDRCPDEAIENTLDAADRVGWVGSYWSSRGHRDPALAECLMYRLQADLCLVDEIRMQPFKAFFRDDEPIYSAKRIRFQMGCPKSPPWSGTTIYSEDEGQLIADTNYIWTYTSPEFPILQENVLQSFKLPHPVLCIGGVVKIELLGGVVKDAFDGLYYICVSHVQIMGMPLSGKLGVAPRGTGVVLSYYPTRRKNRTSQ